MPEWIRSDQNSAKVGRRQGKKEKGLIGQVEGKDGQFGS